MIKLFYVMHEEILRAYTEAKDDIITARSNMSHVDVEAAKNDILKECQIFDFDPENPDDLYSVNNGIAEINIAGMLVNKVDICAAFFGETVTTYKYIREMVQKAESDPIVKKIVFRVNSGGGYVSGCESTFQVIAGCKKHTIAACYDMSASAAYWLASACDEIVGVSKTGFYGSIGVAVEIVNRDKQDENYGIKRIVLTNKTSSNKRPNLMTEEGQSVMVDELNAIYEVFSDSILVKREGKLSKKDLENLDGKVFIAKDAVEYGLIDKAMLETEFEEYINNPVSAGNGSIMGSKNILKDGNNMSLQTILSENPSAKAEYDNDIQAAETRGKKDLQARIDAATPYIGSDKYKGINPLAIKILKGESPVASLEGAVTAFDMMSEQTSSSEAQTETEETGDTDNNGKPPVASTNGKIETEEDIKLAQEKINRYL